MDWVTIRRPDWLEINWKGRHSYGYNQEWYTDEWQRIAGCGPTTATQVMSYVAFRDGLLDANRASDGNEALERMRHMWTYVTPRIGGGLYKTGWFEKGLNDFATEKGFSYRAKTLNVSPFGGKARPTTDEAAAFIRTGIEGDSPVGFLNRHRGKEAELSTWHWVPIVGIRCNAEDVKCRVLDEEIEREFSLANWLRDTALGGGFVYLEKV